MKRTKVCSKCHKRKNIFEFNKGKAFKDRFIVWCKSCAKIYMKKYHIKNREKNNKFMREYYHQHKEERKSYREANKDHYNNWYKQKRKNDVNYRLAHNLRRRIRAFVTKKEKAKSLIELLGCNLYKLRKYLEKQFKPGMSWNNYGKWEIDHIIPCSKFNLSKIINKKKCFNYKNLQPLWAKENKQKGVK